MNTLDSTILDEVGGFIFVLDRGGCLERANRPARELICCEEGWAGKRLEELQPASPLAAELLKRLSELAHSGRDGENCSLRLTCPAGTCLDSTWRVMDLPRLPYRILIGEAAAAIRESEPVTGGSEAASVEEERRRIARELHDETGQSLTSVLIGLRVLESANTLSQVQTHVEELRRIVRDALEGVRRLAAGLRPAAVEEAGLVSALEQLGRDCSQTLGVQIEVDASDVDGADLPPKAEVELYRIAQEALANVGRHAAARKVEVRVRRWPGQVRLTIRDDGQGFEAGRPTEADGHSAGQGLRNIRERARSLGGAARIESWRGTGTVVTVTVPVADEAVGAAE